MRLEEVRAFVMQALRQGGWNQVENLFTMVGDLKARAQRLDRSRVINGSQFLAPGDRSILLEVIWSLIVQGVLVPGLSDSNQGWPFLRLTQYGARCVAEDRILPHDPDGYLREFRGAIPNVDPTIVEYLTESLQCHIHGLYRAGAVMLGGASEKAVLLLIESYTNSIGDLTKKQQFESGCEKAQSMYRKYELFDKHFASVKPRMPKALTEGVDSLLRGVFDLIRNSRNDAGHPAGGTLVDRDVLYSHLRLFVPYCQRIYGLLGWFEANKT
jgi:hypothetical protein